MRVAFREFFRRVKIRCLNASERVGLSEIVLESAWRQQRLLILGYHGVSLDDEHDWNPSLYVPPDLLARRLEVLRQKGCSVLPLDEALRRLYSDSLPKRSVSITFDDGFYDFYHLAKPLLKLYGYPVTLYLTTYYSRFNRPVFDPMCSYLLWKGRGQLLTWPEFSPKQVPLNQEGCEQVARRLRVWSRQGKLSALEKDKLLQELATHVGVDYQHLCDKRILHLITPEECDELMRSGVDVQLHTHRHRASRRRELFLNEIDENRKNIGGMPERPLTHFCYPSGVHRPEMLRWLQESGVVMATTTVPGLAARSSKPLLLPRLLDSSTLHEAEFRGWIYGVASCFPT